MENKEVQQLNLIAIFHFVVGGLGALFACIPLIHVSFGIAMFNDVFPMNEHQHNPPPEWFGMAFIIIGGFAFLFGQIVAWLTIYSGIQIKAQKKYMFSFVIACVLCLFMPFGTILGIFTIIELMKPEVKELYGKTAL